MKSKKRIILAALVASFFMGNVFAAPTTAENEQKIKELQAKIELLEQTAIKNHSSVKDGIGIGEGASVNHAQGTSGIAGIAIGKGAQSHQMSTANHETVIRFGRKPEEMAGGIAIGMQTHARIGTIDIGNRDYKGDIGDLTKANNNQWDADTWNRTAAVGATTIGNNSVNSGNFTSVTGAYNLVSKAYANSYKTFDDLPDKIKNDFKNAEWMMKAAKYNPEALKPYLVKGANVLKNAGAAVQGFGSVVNGSLNSIEAAEKLEADLSALEASGGPKKCFFGFCVGASSALKGAFGMNGKGNPAKGLLFSGFADTVIGMANRTSKSNATIIIGTANEVDHSYLQPAEHLIFGSNTTNAPGGIKLEYKGSLKIDSIKEMADSMRKYAQTNRLGSVGVIGGANKVDYAVFSNINGVGNILQGAAKFDDSTLSEKNIKDVSGFSAFNSLTGYENKAKDIMHTNIQGTHNEVEHAINNVVIGNNLVVKGVNQKDKNAEGNIILGFNAKDKDGKIKDSAKNIVVLGNNIKASKDNSVYLGDFSAKPADDASKDLAEYKKLDGIAKEFAGATPYGIVSVGSTGKERRIQNVAAGLISEKSTDAINGSQLYAVWKELENKKTTTNPATKVDIKKITSSDLTVSNGGDLTKADVDLAIKDGAVTWDKLNIDVQNRFKNNGGEKVTRGSLTGDSIIEVSGKGKVVDADLKLSIKDGSISEEKLDQNVQEKLNKVANINQEFNQLRDETAGVGAMGAALAALKPLQYDPTEKTQIMAGLGRYKHHNAYALGLAVHSNEDLLLNGGIAFGRGTTLMVNAGVTWRVGTDARKDMPKIYRRGPITAMYEMSNLIANIQDENKSLKSENAKQNDEIVTLNEEVRVLRNDNAKQEAEIKAIKEQLAILMSTR